MYVFGIHLLTVNLVAYIYLQWEDPARTLGSYLVALSILIGTHYLPLTQIAVKGGAVIFGGKQFDHCIELWR